MHTKVADEAFLACAEEIRRTGAWQGVPKRDIVRRASLMFYAGGQPRPGVAAHVNGHAVANKPLSSTTGYRMLTETPDGLRRPFLPGDKCEPERQAKQRPVRHETPEHLHELLDWVDGEYPDLFASGSNAAPPASGVTRKPGVPVRVVKALPAGEAEALAAISHEVLQLSINRGPSLLLIEGHDAVARAWISKYGSLAPQVSINVLNEQGIGIVP